MLPVIALRVEYKILRWGNAAVVVLIHVAIAADFFLGLLLLALAQGRETLLKCIFHISSNVIIGSMRQRPIQAR